MGRLWDRIRRHPLVSAVGASAAALVFIGSIWSLWSDRPLLRVVLDAARGSPLTLRVILSVIALAGMFTSFALLVRVILLVRGVPKELKERVPVLESEIGRLRDDYSKLLDSNSKLAAWRDGRRGWEAEREAVLRELAACKEARDHILEEEKLELRLRQRSEPETQFLMLLLEGAPTYNEPGSDLLPRLVYQAGLELARQGIFARRELRDADPLDLFVVPKIALSVLKRIVFPGSRAEEVTRAEVALVLNPIGVRSPSG